MSVAAHDPITRSYEQNGYALIQRPIAGPDLVAAGVAGMEAIRRGEFDTGRPHEISQWAPGDDPTKLCKIEMPQLANCAIRSLIAQRQIGDIVARATGADMVQVWWVQMLYKPSTPAGAAAATKVGWHQDWTYWGCWDNPQGLLTAWLALSDVTEQSGPMLFVPGSHRWGLLPEGDFFSQDDQRQKLPIPPGCQWREVPAVLPPGGFSLHHSLLLHGSGHNHAGRPRLSLAIHLRTQLAQPKADANFARYLHDPDICPVIYQR